MRMRLAAFAVQVAACAVAWSAAAADRLTLDDAFARVAASHPDLRLFSARSEVLAAERERAALRPALVAGATVENAAGSGAFSGVRGAEFTLTLASVLERGGKLDARRTLAQSRFDALAVQREIQRLDLLAEVARRYLSVVAAERRREMAQTDIAQRERTVIGARRRVEVGASPESVVLTAQAALARAELDDARAVQRAQAARQHLAALWGERNPAFAVVSADPSALPAIDDAESLSELLENTPELAEFVSDRRIREARVRLARANAKSDLDWQVGMRRLQSSDDMALIGGLSFSFGAARRAQPEIYAAESELAMLEIEREAKGLSLYSTLTEAHGRYRMAQLEVRRLQDDVLPKLAGAEAAAERAYLAGAISYLEWAQLQSERTNTREQQLDAALDGQLALIEIQRLTGQTFVAGLAASTAQGVSP